MRLIYQLGVVADSCNPATGELELWNGVRSGVLRGALLCRSGVRTKHAIDMVCSAEALQTRSYNENRIGPGWKHSRQKHSVVCSSGIAPVNKGSRAARSISSNSVLFFRLIRNNNFKTRTRLDVGLLTHRTLRPYYRIRLR